MVPQVSLLAGANHTSITNSTFAINVPTNVYNSGPSGISRLLEMTCTRAMHDSSTRQSRCDPNTRQWALQRIKTFVRDPAPLQPVMWLHAPLGHGKSAIMQTSIESAEIEDALLLAGAFFFARRQEGQDTIDHLLTTLAYQIAMKYPELCQHIDNAVSRNPTILVDNVVDSVAGFGPDGPSLPNLRQFYYCGVCRDSLPDWRFLTRLFAAIPNLQRLELKDDVVYGDVVYGGALNDMDSIWMRVDEVEAIRRWRSEGKKIRIECWTRGNLFKNFVEASRTRPE